MVDNRSYLLGICFFFVTVTANSLDQTLLDDIADRVDAQGHKLNEVYDIVTRLAQHLIPSFESSCTTPGNRPKHCLDVLNQGHTRNGIYTIYPFLDQTSLNVYCDLETDGGGWTVIQRRQDGSVSFTRGWNEYRDGFGRPQGEHWLGNKFIYALTTANRSELRIELGDWNDHRVYAKYDMFHVTSEAEEFSLNLGTYTGTAGGDAFRHGSTGVQNGRKFSAIDRDNDAFTESPHCAEKYECGFWFNRCFSANLNGVYTTNPRIVDAKGIVWYFWKYDWNYSLKFTEMKIRPLQ